MGRGLCLQGSPLRWNRRLRVFPQPDCERTGPASKAGFDGAFECAVHVERAIRSGDMQEFVADGQLASMEGRNLHQPAGDIDRIAGGGDVLVAFATQSRRDDRAEMRSDLITQMG